VFKRNHFTKGNKRERSSSLSKMGLLLPKIRVFILGSECPKRKPTKVLFLTPTAFL